MPVGVSSAPSSSGRPAALPQDLIWRLNVEQYHAMIRTGILTEEDPVELLEGWLVYKMPQNPPPRVATRLTQTALERIVPAGWYVDTQAPITLVDSEPEPDVVVVRGEPRTYLDRHPGPQEVALVVEVADTTLLRDQGAKNRLYARAGVPTYWIINLPERRCEEYTDPLSGAEEPDYQQRHDYGIADEIPFVIDAKEVGRLTVAELLP